MSCVRQGSSAGRAACSLCSRSLQQTTATQGQTRTLPRAATGREGAFRQRLVQRVLRGILRMKDAQRLGFIQQCSKESKTPAFSSALGKWGGIHCSGLCSVSLILNVSLLPPLLCSAEMDLVHLVLAVKAGQEGAVICCPPIRTSHFCEIQTQLLPSGEQNAFPVDGNH